MGGKKNSQALLATYSLCSRSFVLLQPVSVGIKTEWECPSVAKAHGEGRGQGSVAGEQLGKIFQSDKGTCPLP